MSATAELDGAVKAAVADGADVQGGSLTVSASATNTVTADIESQGISAFGASGSIALATDTTLVEAYIGPSTGTAGNPADPTVITTSGVLGVDVDASLTSTVIAVTDALGIGLLANGGLTTTTAVLNPTVRAYLGDEAVINSGTAPICFDAEATLKVSADGTGAGVSLGFSGSGALASAAIGDGGSTMTAGAFTEDDGSLTGGSVHFGTTLNADGSYGAYADVTLTNIGLLAGISGGAASGLQCGFRQAG